MLVYKDIITGDELFSDSYPMKLVDDLYYKVTGELTIESSNIDESKIGGNASAEDAAQEFDENAVSGVDIVLANRLKELAGLDKKSYMTFFKSFAQNLLKYYTKSKPDQVDSLKERLVTLRKEVSAMWKKEEFQVFQGEQGENEGMFALLGYDDETPYMIFFKDGLVEEKC